ncbi:MAG: GtrA family protein [Saprospiraceae bacterium]|jgi:putative flippase GtrA|nr:GtrA family protein [Saprospiraceae bacterium]MBP6238499.1 GtrA family protein [Saprospiraceae bacterium]MBP6565792.1 GtrA family protein [Saprospiraceae bacterium]
MNQDHNPKQNFERPPFKKTFIRSQVVSLISTAVDFAISILLHHSLSLYYVTATSLGSLAGAMTSFTLGRNWAFLNRHGHIRKQFLRFVVINLFSIFANTTGVFFFKESFDIPFIISRIIVSVLIGVFFNFFMNRYFVFR